MRRIEEYPPGQRIIGRQRRGEKAGLAPAFGTDQRKKRAFWRYGASLTDFPVNRPPRTNRFKRRPLPVQPQVAHLRLARNGAVKNFPVNDQANKAWAVDYTAKNIRRTVAEVAKLSGKAIVEIHQTSGAWTTTGHGAGLTIHDIKGVDAITGGGASEDFVFLAGWGNATISDFDKHYTGAGHDIVTLPGSEFVKGDATLLADAKPGDGGVIVTAGQDKLIFTGLTIAELNAGITAGDFKFA